MLPTIKNLINTALAIYIKRLLGYLSCRLISQKNKYPNRLFVLYLLFLMCTLFVLDATTYTYTMSRSLTSIIIWIYTRTVLYVSI